MQGIIKRTVHIFNLEVFNGLKFRIGINLLFLISLVGLQLGDITLKVSGNYFLTTWISINSYLAFSLFKKKNRNFILEINSLSGNKKIALQYAVSILINFLWFIVIVLQFIFVMDASFINAFFVAMIQYLFAISLGAFSSIFYEKNIGLMGIIGLGVMNFLFYNPLIYEGSSHLFSISEQMYAMNEINIVNLLSLLVLIFLFVSFTHILMKPYQKHIIKKMLLVTCICVVCYSTILYFEKVQYEAVQSKAFLTANYEGNDVKYRGISEERAEEIYHIISALEDQYKKIQSTLDYSELILDKTYLSTISWKFQGITPKTVIIDRNVIKVQLLSNSMLNFNESDLFRNFIDEVRLQMAQDISGYHQSRYTRQLVEGYSIAIQRDVCDYLEQKQAQSVKQYYIDDIDAIFSCPTTKFNYVYRVALLVYDQHPDQIAALYKSTLEQKVKTDDAFIELLKTNFRNIYDDIKVQNILKSVKSNL